jgi:hypothetical protein
LANTEFVQRALGNESGVEIVAANRTMTAADAGKYLFSNANNLVYTLPNPSGLPFGTKFRIAQGSVTSGGSIEVPGGVTIGQITDGGTVSAVPMAQRTEYVLTVVSATAYQLTRLAATDIVAPGAAPLYACRAWVNFDGTTTTPTIRASGNVSSVTKHGTGDYTVNLTTAMPDTNWSSQCDSRDEDLSRHAVVRCTNNGERTKTTSTVPVIGKTYRHLESDKNNPSDLSEAMVSVFR